MGALRAPAWARESTARCWSQISGGCSARARVARSQASRNSPRLAESIARDSQSPGDKLSKPADIFSIPIFSNMAQRFVYSRVMDKQTARATEPKSRPEPDIFNRALYAESGSMPNFPAVCAQPMKTCFLSDTFFSGTAIPERAGRVRQHPLFAHPTHRRWSFLSRYVHYFITQV